MGCPAKKVCNKWAGSALMRDEPLALEIVQAVVDAAQRRTACRSRSRCAPAGAPTHRNAVKLARDFESAGVQMLTVHGRTREQGYKGAAEYDTIAAVKAAVRVPVVANGDITHPEKARDVLAATGADAVMVGRAAQGRPWIFREIAHFLETGTHLRAAAGGGSAPLAARPSRRSTMGSTATTAACARRASTSAGMCARCPGARTFADA